MGGGGASPGITHSSLCPAFQCFIWHSRLQYRTSLHRPHGRSRMYSGAPAPAPMFIFARRPHRGAAHRSVGQP